MTRKEYIRREIEAGELNRDVADKNMFSTNGKTIKKGQTFYWDRYYMFSMTISEIVDWKKK